MTSATQKSVLEDKASPTLGQFMLEFVVAGIKCWTSASAVLAGA